ncbi:hypothetical protein niasHT_003445 [Heterodera trifolii]|uniref:BTB domain-containing protein n=1 Tax=Heterodera trifolii TaxID=157864 RepID=A0ABD2M1Y6_9BILA
MPKSVVKHLLSTGEDADVYLLVGDGDAKELLPAHKLILKHVSDVFEAMLRFDAKNEKVEFASANCPVEVIDVEAAAFKVMLSFIYTEDLSELNGDNAMAVLLTLKNMNTFLSFTTILLFFIVHMATLCVGGGNDDDFNREQLDPQSTGHGYYGQPDGGYNYGQFGGGFHQQSSASYNNNNYGHSSGYTQQPTPSYGYALNPQYSHGYAQQPNFHRSQSDVHHYNQNQPPPGNFGRSQSDVHDNQSTVNVPPQSTSYSDDNDEEETHRPAAGSSTKNREIGIK